MNIGGVVFNAGDLGVVSLLFAMFTLLVTDTLVTGRRLKKSEARADRLEEKVWTLMETTQVAVVAAEVAADVIRNIPDPLNSEGSRPS